MVPAFQAAGTIGRTLASLTAQRRADWEAIVVDDGSGDATAAIVARWAAADPRIRLLRQPNAGAAAARNRGLAAARGAWTLFLDADDTIDPAYLAVMLRGLGRSGKADAIACGHVRPSADGTRLARTPAPRLDRDPIGLCDLRPPTAIHAIVCRTTLLRDLGGFDTRLATNEDWDLWRRLARAGARFAIEHRALAHYRSAPASLTRDGAAMLRDTLAMLGRIADDGGVPVSAQAAFDALMWNAGMAIGGGGSGLALPALLPGLRHPSDPARAIAALAEGLMLGAGRPYRDLLPAWERFGPRVEALLAEVEGRCGPPPGPSLARRIEREVIRMARFATAARAGRSLGVMLAPHHLVRGIAPVAGVERLVAKVPFVRPRSLLMVEADLGDGLSGGAIRRLLGDRLAGRGEG